VYDPHSKAAPDEVKRARAILLGWLEQWESDDDADVLAAAKPEGSVGGGFRPAVVPAPSVKQRRRQAWPALARFCAA
jgi:hypothetical protein